jgi:murein DD-endopeptidase MepM/ murein hydrolase activator NlpD
MIPLAAALVYAVAFTANSAVAGMANAAVAGTGNAGVAGTGNVAVASTTTAAVAVTAGLDVQPPEAKPGDAILLRLPAGDAEPTALVEGRAVRFWKVPDGWRAIAGLPVEVPLGPLTITAHVGHATVQGRITVVDPAFPAKKLTLPPKFIEPPASLRARIAADQRAFNEAFTRPFAPPGFEGPFALPVPGEATGHYGDRRTYNGKQTGQHYGLDLNAAMGTPVLAANGGVVVMARDNYYAGITVLVWHGADLYSAYFHLSELRVKVGQQVARGEPVALSGSTGQSTGPHLHWGIKVGGRWVDPESVVRLGEFASGSSPLPH